MKYIKSVSWFLGIAMFMFGFLKFFPPFKGWYTVQIATSELSELAYVMGIIGELSVGITFIFSFLFKDKISARLFVFVIIGASLMVVIMMVTGMYVHLHPSVPAEVLPLGIKPPYIPAFFLLMGLTNAIYMV
jgi:hypothetical protein